MTTTYRVWFTSTASTFVDVTADSADNAVDKAYPKIDAKLCHHCSTHVELGDDWDPNEAEALEL